MHGRNQTSKCHHFYVKYGFVGIFLRCYLSEMLCFWQGLKTAIVEGDVVGGTCVNRGCVPSKALLAVSGRMRELQSEHHMKALGLQVYINSLFSLGCERYVPCLKLVCILWAFV